MGGAQRGRSEPYPRTGGDPASRQPSGGVYEQNHGGVHRRIARTQERGGGPFSESAPWPGWIELWAIARYDLGLSEQGFAALTPRQFVALQKRLVLKNQALDYRAGVIASIVANCNRGEDTEPFQPSDFFPNLRALEPKEQGDDLDKLMALQARLGGEVIMVEQEDGTT